MGDEVDILKNIGYDSFFEKETIKLNFPSLFPARVIAQYKEAYKVKDINGEFLAKITGKQIFEARQKEDYPAVGDWVLVDEADGDHAIIKNILPRKTIIRRKFGNKNKLGQKEDIQIIATNIDTGFVIESVDRDYNLNRFERYFSILEDGKVKPAIILNKIDLLSEEERNNKINELQSRFPSVDIIFTSTLNNNGIDDLKNYISKGETYCFLGSSGVGKSSLINKLIGKDLIKTTDISLYSDRGKHTTTGRQMYFLDNGGIVIDNPGIREVGLIDMTEGVDGFFDEISFLGKKCKYTDCTHTHEPGCLILESKESGLIDEDKYNNYTTLKKEVEYNNMSESDKRQKNKNFGKFIKKAKKDFKNFGYGNYQ